MFFPKVATANCLVDGQSGCINVSRARSVSDLGAHGSVVLVTPGCTHLSCLVNPAKLGLAPEAGPGLPLGRASWSRLQYITEFLKPPLPGPFPETILSRGSLQGAHDSRKHQSRPAEAHRPRRILLLETIKKMSGLNMKNIAVVGETRQLNSFTI